ncbi:hypothetical protein RRG08_023521 [Elysia crispata]|uniref:Uncharacterized protein n=1 Tax=Elysia crispata TaxID=231223 RepID=A0AAE1D7N4_9GAST|nr:hypothetical protein RRG08_023521 [Elysia crispata]
MPSSAVEYFVDKIHPKLGAKAKLHTVSSTQEAIELLNVGQAKDRVLGPDIQVTERKTEKNMDKDQVRSSQGRIWPAMEMSVQKTYCGEYPG